MKRTLSLGSRTRPGVHGPAMSRVSISRTLRRKLEGMARTDRREIRNRLTVLLIHLLKYMVQPRRRSTGWIGIIGEQRRRIATVIDDSPSLRSFPASILDQRYAAARSGAASETRLPESAFPESCPPAASSRRLSS